MLTQDLLNEIFTYDPETGVLERRVPKHKHGNGRGEPSWYPCVCIAGKSHRIHRVIWLLVYGHIPKGMQIDHINGIKTDNRLANLRLASQQQNLSNVSVRSNSATGVKGVEVTPEGKFKATIRVDGVKKFLGHHSTLIQAGRAYDTAALAHFGEFARTNAMMGLLPDTSANV